METEKNKQPIKQFIANIACKEYGAANEYLQQAIENKLKERIRASLAQKNNQN